MLISLADYLAVHTTTRTRRSTNVQLLVASSTHSTHHIDAAARPVNAGAPGEQESSSRMLSRPPAEPANTVGRMQQRHARSVWRALAERSNDVRDLTLMVQTVILQACS